jgi:hypothetical protein
MLPKRDFVLMWASRSYHTSTFLEIWLINVAERYRVSHADCRKSPETLETDLGRRSIVFFDLHNPPEILQQLPQNVKQCAQMAAAAWQVRGHA